MELLGRDEELLSLTQFLASDSGRNLVLHGPNGTGKSYFLKKVRAVRTSDTDLCLTLTIRDPLAPAQTFLFETIEILLESLNSTQLQESIRRVREIFDPKFSIQEWCQSYDSPFLESGFLFLKILKCIQQTVDEKILIIYDQVENLGSESRSLLKNVIEWKPEQVYFILGLSTTEPGKESILKDYGADFFFKANQYLEMRTIDRALEQSYCDLYGIDEALNESSFMSWALEQKRLWLQTQCSTDEGLRGLCVFLAHFPSGLQHKQNPKLEDYFQHLSRQRLLGEIFCTEGERLCFSHFQYCTDLQEKFSEQYASCYDEAYEVLLEENLSHRLIVKEIEGKGIACEDTLNQLITTYRITLTLSTLEDLAEASLHEDYSQECKLRLQSSLEFLGLAKSFSEQQADEFRQYFVDLEPKEKAELGPLLLPLFKKNEEIPLYSRLYLEPDLIPHEKEFFVSACFERIKSGETLEPESIQRYEKVFDPCWLGELQKLLSYLTATEQATIPDVDSSRFPVLGAYVSALGEIENENYSQACKQLREGLSNSLKSRDFSLHSLLLTRLAECYDKLGDLDSQLSIYREAVIAEQFLV